MLIYVIVSTTLKTGLFGGLLSTAWHDCAFFTLFRFAPSYEKLTW